MLVGWSILLIIHGILAVFCWCNHPPGGGRRVARCEAGKRFLQFVRGVNGMSYTNAVIVLFVVTFALGCVIYPTYRINVRTILQEYRFFKPEGAFEMKEHLLALSLAALPIYWYFWRNASETNRVARVVLTSMIAVAVWWGFLTVTSSTTSRIRIMTKVERLLAVFAIAFAVIYAPTMDFNWTLATITRSKGLAVGRAPPISGGSPAMYWYGFLFTSALGHSP